MYVLDYLIYIVFFPRDGKSRREGDAFAPDHHQAAFTVSSETLKMDSDDEFDDARLGIGVSRDKKCTWPSFRLHGGADELNNVGT